MNGTHVFLDIWSDNRPDAQLYSGRILLGPFPHGLVGRSTVDRRVAELILFEEEKVEVEDLFSLDSPPYTP